jgi:hypothetical protein
VPDIRYSQGICTADQSESRQLADFDTLRIDGVPTQGGPLQDAFRFWRHYGKPVVERNVQVMKACI